MPDNNTATENQAESQAQTPEITADVQALIDSALAKQSAEFNAQKELHVKTGNEFKAMAENFKSKFEASQIQQALLGAASEAVSPNFIKDILTAKAVCDAEGVVTIDGNPVADVVKRLFAENPFLAKAQGSSGSGAPTGAHVAQQLTRSAFEGLKPHERSRFISTGGKVTD